MKTFLLERLDTPTGVMLLVVDETGALRAADWENKEARMHRFLRLHYGEGVTLVPTSGSAAGAAFQRYFAGDLTALGGLKMETAGTPFQRSVWAALRTIPAGKAVTYGALATQIGKPSAVRAVGLANGSNPIAIATPCHRVIGSNGTLTGFGGGLDRKAWLLTHEGVSFKETAA